MTGDVVFVFAITFLAFTLLIAICTAGVARFVGIYPTDQDITGGDDA